MKLKEKIIIAAIVLIAFGTHFFNMFNYPYYENDEGTYMSQAWSLIEHGKLAPYTYWYDHAPGGWFIIALWVKLTGGFFTFGESVNSGRVLMLVMHIASSLLLYYIAKKTSGSKQAGFIAAVLFSFSPLGIYFQRRVLLDNEMIFLVLASFALLLKGGQKIMYLIASALTFGLAILTKENAVFFIPVFLYYIYVSSSKHQKEFMVGKWLVISLLVTSTYFLYAFLKGEFFPSSNGQDHVSLLVTLKNQYSRGINLPFWDSGSYFYRNFLGWIYKDPVIIIAGTFCTVVNLVLSIFNKKFRIAAFLSLAFCLFLLRGKLVIDFYIVPLIPLLALNIGILLSAALTKISFGKTYLNWYLTFVFLLLLVYLQNIQGLPVYTKNETINQVSAIKWIKENLDANAKIVIDDAIYVDLHDKKTPKEKVFNNAEWSWKVEKDPEVLKGKIGNTWTNIEYIVLSHEILKQIKDSEFPLLKRALANSELVQMWNEQSTSYVDPVNHISTNGDWMAVYKVHDKNKIILQKSWDFYKSNFLKSYGQVVDPSNNNTTSEGQSYAMLRAVILNDKDIFTNVWKWTKDHMQHRVQDNLLSWLWLNDENGGKLGDSEAASDADQDVALALIMAYKKWGDDEFLRDAQLLINDIWESEVVEVNGHYYLMSGPGSEREEGYLVNPSYLSPAWYRVFAQYDKSHEWEKLADDTYYFLNNLNKQNDAVLPPDWVMVEKETGKILSPAKYVSDINASWYGFNAFRTNWRIAMDREWFGSAGSAKYIESITPFFEKEVKNKLYAIYSLDGNPRSNYTSLSTTTGAYFAFYGKDKTLADSFFQNQIASQFNVDEGYWGDKTNYFDQNWAWFATAVNSEYFQRP